MPRLSDTGLQEYDNNGGGDIKAWVNPKDIIGYPVTIVGLGKKHVEAFYFPSGDFSPEHDEPVVRFTFDNPLDGEDVMQGDWEDGAVYGFSTNAARLKSVFAHVDPTKHLPLEGVCILLDERGKYSQLYLGEADSGEKATIPQDSEPTRPTTSERDTSQPDSRNEPREQRSDRQSTGGQRPTDRKTVTART